MAANTSPRFTGRGDPQWTTTAVLAANTTKDMTSGTIYLIYTAPTDGGIVDSIIAQPLGTNVATVLRLWLNNGSTTATAGNNSYVGQWTLPATTNSETAAIVSIILPLPRFLQDVPSTYRLYATVGTAVASGWQLTANAARFAL